MKFGQVFKEALRKEGFPSEWVNSAISYSQLKKCINRLTNELAELGLDPGTLNRLLRHVEDFNALRAVADGNSAVAHDFARLPAVAFTFGESDSGDGELANRAACRVALRSCPRCGFIHIRDAWALPLFLS